LSLGMLEIRSPIILARDSDSSMGGPSPRSDLNGEPELNRLGDL
jgi:hypothetical protein